MVALCALLVLTSTPKEALFDALKGYQGLSSFSATIEHQDDSGLFPGHYIQALKWTKDRHFTLNVILKSDYKPVAAAPGRSAPDYACDGTLVTASRFGEPPKVDPIDQGPNTMPGWEVSGGLILSSLMKTRTLDFIANSPALSFAAGTQTQWQGEAVREIVMSINGGEGSRPASLFLSVDGKTFVGLEADLNGKRGWMHYRKQSAKR